MIELWSFPVKRIYTVAVCVFAKLHVDSVIKPYLPHFSSQ